MKRKYAVFAVVFALLLVVGIQVVEVVDANPFVYNVRAPAPANVSPPVIIIASPTVNLTYSNNETIVVCFNVTGPQGPNLLTKYIKMVDFKGDWMRNAELVFGDENTVDSGSLADFLEFNFSVTAPSGKHNLNITAHGGGSYVEGNNYNIRKVFTLNSSLLVDFSVASPTLNTSPTPSASTTLSQSAASNYLIEQTFLAAVFGVIITVAVALVSLIYLKKRKKIIK